MNAAPPPVISSQTAIPLNPKTITQNPDYSIPEGLLNEKKKGREREREREKERMKVIKNIR